MKHKWLAAAVLMLGGIGVANAHTDLSISVGVPLPGVYYDSYYAPPPPPPVYYRERVYYEPRPVYYAPRPVYYAPRYYGPRRYDRDVHYERDGRWDHRSYDRHDHRRH
jgi:hypothetical protein